MNSIQIYVAPNLSSSSFKYIQKFEWCDAGYECIHGNKIKNCVTIDRSFMLEQIDPWSSYMQFLPLEKTTYSIVGIHQNKLKVNISSQ